MRTKTNSNLLTIADLRARWSVSRTTIWREVKARKLRQTMIGGSARFQIRDVEKYEKENG